MTQQPTTPSTGQPVRSPVGLAARRVDSPVAAARRRGALVAVVVLGLVALVGYAVRDVVFTDGPRGPRGSSYATGPTGMSRYADLLDGAGHPVEQRRLPLDVGDPLDPATTVVVLDGPGLRRSEARALRTFVINGGRLVIGGDPGEWLADVVDDAPEWYGEGQESCRRYADVPEAAGVTDVALTGKGQWLTTGRATPFLQCRGVAVGLVQNFGNGRIVYLADTGPLQNQYLAAYDDAVLGVAVTGPGGRHVVFAEQVHGFDPPKGLLALPHGLPLALGLLGLAGGLALLARPQHPGAATATAASEASTGPAGSSGAAPPTAGDRRTAVRERWERTGDLASAVAVLRTACREVPARLDEQDRALLDGERVPSEAEVVALADLHRRLTDPTPTDPTSPSPSPGPSSQENTT